uniref:Uncharacterized protein n=1 Tax=Cucumis melo TaxID=3656 RepID=A0A9I9EBH2_CUCME
MVDTTKRNGWTSLTQLESKLRRMLKTTAADFWMLKTTTANLERHGRLREI